MKYFVTMYIKNMQTLSIIPHAFLGLTHTHPDELDSLGDIEIEKYSNPQSCMEVSFEYPHILKSQSKARI